MTATTRRSVLTGLSGAAAVGAVSGVAIATASPVHARPKEILIEVVNGRTKQSAWIGLVDDQLVRGGDLPTEEAAQIFMEEMTPVFRAWKEDIIMVGEKANPPLLKVGVSRGPEPGGEVIGIHVERV